VLPQEDTLHSMQNTALIAPKHVTRHGYPVFPQLLVSSKALLTADGSYVPDLTYPYDAIFDDVHTRFIAQDNLFDDTANVWTPFLSSGVNYYFTWSGLNEPRMEQIEYRIDKLVYPMNSIRLEEGTSLVSSFNSNMDDASSFMIAIAGLVNSTERATLLRVGDVMGTSISIEIDEFFVIRNQYGSATVKTTVHPAKMIPFYMVLINDPTKTELNIATGNSRISRATIPNQDSTRSLELFVGESLSGTKTLDMNLFELTFFPYAYGGPMSADEIIKAMSDVYGNAT